MLDVSIKYTLKTLYLFNRHRFDGESFIVSKEKETATSALTLGSLKYCFLILINVQTI